MNEEVQFKEIDYGSEAYQETLQLRHRILRAPLGLHFSKEECERESHDFHLAGYHHQQLVACMVLTPLEETVMKMRQVSVTAEWQGHGLGKKMVEVSESFCRNKQIKTIVLSARDQVVPFYLKLGYKIISDVFIEVNIPHLKMEKNF